MLKVYIIYTYNYIINKYNVYLLEELELQQRGPVLREGDYIF